MGYTLGTGAIPPTTHKKMTTYTSITKAQAIAEFRELYAGKFRGDAIARREAWLDFIDNLCWDRRIDPQRRDNWTNPF